VADPFMLRVGRSWHMFFEMMPAARRVLPQEASAPHEVGKSRIGAQAIKSLIFFDCKQHIIPPLVHFRGRRRR
jgi:hypothetical protein